MKDINQVFNYTYAISKNYILNSIDAEGNESILLVEMSKLLDQDSYEYTLYKACYESRLHFEAFKTSFELFKHYCMTNYSKTKYSTWLSLHDFKYNCNVLYDHIVLLNDCDGILHKICIVLSHYFIIDKTLNNETVLFDVLNAFRNKEFIKVITSMDGYNTNSFINKHYSVTEDEPNPLKQQIFEMFKLRKVVILNDYNNVVYFLPIMSNINMHNKEAYNRRNKLAKQMEKLLKEYKDNKCL